MTEFVTNTWSKDFYYLNLFNNLKNSLLIMKCVEPEEQNEVLVNLLHKIAVGLRGDRT